MRGDPLGQLHEVDREPQRQHRGDLGEPVVGQLGALGQLGDDSCDLATSEGHPHERARDNAADASRGLALHAVVEQPLDRPRLGQRDDPGDGLGRRAHGAPTVAAAPAYVEPEPPGLARLDLYAPTAAPSPAASRRMAALSVASHVKSGSSRPKWP